MPAPSSRESADADCARRDTRVLCRSLVSPSSEQQRILKIRVRADTQVLEAGVDGERHDHRVRSEPLRQAVCSDDVTARVVSYVEREGRALGADVEAHLSRIGTVSTIAVARWMAKMKAAERGW